MFLACHALTFYRLETLGGSDKVKGTTGSGEEEKPFVWERRCLHALSKGWRRLVG